MLNRVRCRDEASTVCPATSLLAHRAKHTPQDLVDTDLSSYHVAGTRSGRYPSHLRSGSIWNGLFCFLWPQWHRRFPMFVLIRGFQVFIKNSCLIINDGPKKRVWFSLKCSMIFGHTWMKSNFFYGINFVSTICIPKSCALYPYTRIFQTHSWYLSGAPSTR